MEEMIIYDVGFMLGASKRRSHKDQVTRMFSTYIGFLQNSALTTRTIVAPGAVPDATTRIMRSDLTDEGFEFVKRAEQKWFRAVDRGGSPESTGILEKELSILRAGKD
jgi:hypothetical protein